MKSKSLKEAPGFLPVIMAAFLILLGSSCSKEDNDDNNNDKPQENEMKVKIDGNEWSGNIGSIATSGGTTQINATNNSDTSMIQIFFPEDTTGSFVLSDTSVITVSYFKNNQIWNDNITGTFELFENNSNEISGTVSATLASPFANTDTLTLTEGIFYWSP